MTHHTTPQQLRRRTLGLVAVLVAAASIPLAGCESAPSTADGATPSGPPASVEVLSAMNTSN